MDDVEQKAGLVPTRADVHQREAGYAEGGPD